MVATFLRSALVTHWLLHIPVQIFFLSHFGALESLVLSFLIEYTN